MGLFLICIMGDSVMAAESDVSHPETIVEISLDKLQKGSPRKAAVKVGLPADFAQQVIQAIRDNRESLRLCVTEGQTMKKSVTAKIAIEKTGKGIVNLSDSESLPSTMETCLVKILEGIEYPKHSALQPARVRLPLILENEVL